jgi:hypothetical protein
VRTVMLVERGMTTKLGALRLRDAAIVQVEFNVSTSEEVLDIPSMLIPWPMLPKV